MGQIRITPEELRGGASQINSLAATVTDNLNELQRIVNSITDNWEGAAQSTYAQNYQQLHAEFMKTFPPTIEGLATQMTEVANTLEETDNSIVSSLAGGR